MSKDIGNFSAKACERIETTIGDLIEAVTQIALEAGKTEAEGYQLASMTLENILRKNRKAAFSVN